MADRQKVIQALENCICYPKRCQNCPWDVGGEKCSESFSESLEYPPGLVEDALALLKEQEPRVLTREEVIHSNDWIWYEWKNTHYGWTISVACDGKWIEWEDSTTDQLCKYGKKWRCWTSRPSPEQMRDTKWEDTGNG